MFIIPESPNSVGGIRACFHVPSPSPCPSQSLSKFINGDRPFDGQMDRVPYFFKNNQFLTIFSKHLPV